MSTPLAAFNTVYLFDYEVDAQGNALPNEQVVVTLVTALTSTGTNPAAQVQNRPIRVLTDANGYWVAAVLRESDLNPANTYYSVRSSARTRDVQLLSTDTAGSYVQASTREISGPNVFPPNIWNAVVHGTLTVDGLATFDGGLQLAGGTAAGVVNGLYQPAANEVALATNSLQALLVDASQNVTITGALTVDKGATVQSLAVSGLTGATAASRYVGANGGGPPSSGTWLTGDWLPDPEGAEVWICTAGGTPGIWKAVGQAYSVLDYGAKFDGSTDDSAAIQAALNAAAMTGYMGLTGNDVPAIPVTMPPGRAVVNTTLVVPPNCWLKGAGPSSTYLVRTSGATADIIQTSGVQCYLTDFGIIDNATPTAGAAIHVETSGASILGDSRHVIRDVVIVGAYDGVFIDSGNTECRVTRVTAQRVVRCGFYAVGTDCFFTDCTAGEPGANGFCIAGGNSRVVSCKSYGGSTAYGPTGSNAAFVMGGAGRHEVVGCEAQDAANDAFDVGGNEDCLLTGCLADSCGGYGFSDGFVGAPGNVSIDNCVVLMRVGGAHKPYAGIYFVNSTAQRVTLRAVDFTGTNPFPPISSSTYGVSGDYCVNQQRGWQNLAYAATVTPDPFAGEHVMLATITGAIELANPVSMGPSSFYMAGAELFFTLPVDATGGYALTFGTNYKIVGAPPALGANTTVTMHFQYDGTYWREVSRSITS